MNESTVGDGQYCMDANVFITCRNVHYFMDTIPSLWNALVEHRQKITLIKPIFDEIDPFTSSHKSMNDQDKWEKYPLRMWLVSNGFYWQPIDNAVRAISLELEREYQTKDKGTGADSNDMLLIAYAKHHGKTIVTYEKKQETDSGMKKSNYKIPAICKEQGVKCITFSEFLRECGISI